MEQEELEKLILQNAQADRERVLRDQADREAFNLIKEKEEEEKEEQKKKEDDFRRSPAKEGSDTIDRSSDVDKNIGDEEEKVSDFEALKKKYLEKSELYKELLGNPKEMIKKQGFLQLAQFGLNLASAQGSNFLDKVAKSAKDPLNAFAELGRKAYEDERAVNLLALEATEKDIAADEDAILRKELAILAKDDPDNLTNFQKNLATIEEKLGDQYDMETKIRMARGLSGGDSRADRIQATFDTIANLPLNLGKSQDVLMQEAANFVDFMTGEKEEIAPSSQGVITEDVILTLIEKNPNVDREAIISDLEAKGYDVSNVK